MPPVRPAPDASGVRFPLLLDGRWPDPGPAPERRAWMVPGSVQTETAYGPVGSWLSWSTPTWSAATGGDAARSDTRTPTARPAGNSQLMPMTSGVVLAVSSDVTSEPAQPPPA